MGVKYRLTRPVWLDSTRKLPAGSIVELPGEPGGVYRGRCEPLEVATPEPAERQAKGRLKADASE